MARVSLALVLGVALGSSAVRLPAQPVPQAASSQSERVAWVAETLKRMQTITVGRTRADLLTMFTTEGGLSTGLRRTYVSRDCPYFKVDVEFQAVGRPERDSDGRVTLIENEQDIIARISRPYLQLSVLD
jgi:hypothetical protein